MNNNDHFSSSGNGTFHVVYKMLVNILGEHMLFLGEGMRHMVEAAVKSPDQGLLVCDTSA